jgi:hypothetical protein
MRQTCISVNRNAPLTSLLYVLPFRGASSVADTRAGRGPRHLQAPNSSIKPTAGPYSAAAEQYLHVGTAAANRSRRKYSLVAAAAAPTRSRRGLARGGLSNGR